MKLIRVRYGKKDTKPEDREYQIDGVGPVGTLNEYKEHFPGKTFEIVERDEEELKKAWRAGELPEEYKHKNQVKGVNNNGYI